VNVHVCVYRCCIRVLSMFVLCAYCASLRLLYSVTVSCLCLVWLRGSAYIVYICLLYLPSISTFYICRCALLSASIICALCICLTLLPSSDSACNRVALHS